MYKYAFTATQDGLLLNLVGRELPLLSKKAVREALKKRDIKVNGQRVNENIAVSSGDGVLVYSPIAQREIEIVFEDADCLVVNKPAGINSDENERSGFSLLGWAQGRYGKAVSLAHRLDNQTGGLLMLAKNEKAAEALKAMLKERRVQKEYVCLAKGRFEARAAVETAYLVKDSEKGRVSISRRAAPGSREIVTEYQVLENGLLARVKVILHTGRTHQIRAHLAFLGHPVLGDEVYGQREFNRAHKAGDLKLFSVALAFPMDCEIVNLRGQRFECLPPF